MRGNSNTERVSLFWPSLYSLVKTVRPNYHSNILAASAAVPDLEGSLFSLVLAVFVPKHRQSIVVKVFDHRQSKAGPVADVLVRTSVDAMTQSRADVRLAQTGQAGVFVQQARQRTVNSVQIYM